MSKQTLFMAGFGSSSNSASKAQPKLKPKAQWDRYIDLKKATPVAVAVRVVRQDAESDWLEVGKIKSEKDEFTEMAVVSQRALLADHAKRLFPLQIAAKDKVEWAFASSGGEWVAVNKDSIQDMPVGLERKIGFEGTPDPSSGFYCHYVDGRLE